MKRRQASRNHYAAEAASRLREKLRLALGPAFERDETELLARTAPALRVALESHDASRAERMWREHAAARRARGTQQAA